MDSIIRRAFSPFAAAWRVIVLTLIICATGQAWAATNMTNTVTGETETYENVFTGAGETATEWNSADNWTLKESGKVPFVSGGNYDPALVSNKTVSTSTAIDGWTLRVGAYDGAAVTWNGGITKIQAGSAGCWLTADETSSITASFNGNNKQLEGSDTYPFKLSSASAGGITWTSGLASAGNTTLPFWYYLKGAGTVVYGGDITVANAQVIKMADVTLSGNEKSVQSKTLVTFGSGTTKTFTADATIKRLNSSGTDLNDDAHVATVNTTGTTTLTTSDAVGTCELVQTSTGIVLYWVDGDPAALTPTVYKPSININFTSGTALSTGADVGIGDYAVPGTSWNNLIGNNGSLADIKSVDSKGTATTLAGASVTISGTRGYWTRDGLAAASDLRQGYIDDNDGNATPQFVVTGIPYYKYQLVLYFSNDTDGRPFGHLTVNGTNYKWDSTNNEIVTCTGTSADVWGSSDSTSYTEGGNYLVFPALDNTDGTLTVIGHRWSGTQRAGLAAVQIIEVKPEAGDGDLVIELSGDRTYTVSEAQDLSGTVYLTGSGTLTLDGSAKITAATIDVGPNVTLNINADRLDATTFTGAGTVVYDGVVPPTGKGWTDSENWIGTVWIKNRTITGNNNATTGVQPNSLGNTKSKVKFSGVNGWLEAPIEYNPEIVLENAGYDYALQLTNGNSPDSNNGDRCTKIKKLSGSGTLGCGGNTYAWPLVQIWDATAFTGSIDTSNAGGNGVGNTGLVVVFCSENTEFGDTLYNLFKIVDSGSYPHPHSIYVASDTTVTQASTATWNAVDGFGVDGTLYANGALASSHETKAVSGTGTVVFGGVPSPTGDAWWKNSDWNGTVQIGNITDMIGRTSGYTGTYLDFNSYGNAISLVKLGNLTGWMDNYTCNVPVNLAGTLTINNGVSGDVFTFKKLISSGGYITATDQSATFSIRIEDGSEYAGYIGLNSKRVIFGTGTAPAFVKGQIYVSSDATITVPSVNTAYWSVGGILVDGELKADNLARFGGGTNITTGDDGVFTLTSTGNGSEGETDTDYARIKGTGSLKYDGTGWRALSTNNFPTAVTLVNEQAGDILLSRALTYTVGSLSGSKNFQGNYGSGTRYLNVIQSKDTEWSGKVVDDGSSRFAGLKLDASSTGTLTLSGTASQNVALEVNGGAVNLTGTWVGAATVAGTIGGTGTLTGNLTMNDGSTFKAFATGENGLSVSGTPSWSGTVTVDVSAIADSITSSGVTLITSTGNITTSTDISALSVTSGYFFLKPETDVLKVYPLAATVTWSDDSVTPYPSLQAALNDVASSSYKYVTAYESTTVEYYSASPLKMKTSGEGVVVTLHFPGSAGDFGWAGGEPDEDGIVTYSPSATPTVYTWGGGESGDWLAYATNWKFGDNYSANRPPMDGDYLIITNNTTITVVGNQKVSSITNSAVVTFRADSAASITNSTGGIVLSVAGASITVDGVALSPTPTTSVANYAVQTTVVDDTTTYTAVPAVAKVDDDCFATMAEAEEALKTGGTLVLLDDYDGTITIYPGKYLVLNSHTVTAVIGADTDGSTDAGIVAEELYTGVWTCHDYRTASWCGASEGEWTSLANWSEMFKPRSATAVTIPATEGHVTAILLTEDVSVKSLTLGAGETLTLTKSAGPAVTLTTTSAIVLTSGQSIVTGSGVSISPAITTTDVNSYVKSVTDGAGNTTYTVATKVASVTDSGSNVTYYDSLATAFSSASTGDSIALFSDTSDPVALSGKTINFSEGSYTYTGSFTGNGTVVLGAALKAASSDRWPVGWTGTVELKNITTIIENFNFAHYGNANSTVRANDVLVRMPETGGEYGNVGEINLVGEGLRFGGDPIAGQDFTFSAAISGTGKIRVGTRCETASPAHTRYIFKGDLSDFAGGVDYNETGWYKATIVFQAGTDEIPAGNNGEWGQIILTENTTISLGGEMYGPAGIIVAGSINVLDGGSVRVDSPSGKQIYGAGKIVYATFPASAPAFNNSWAGEVHLPANASITGTNFGDWGKSGSKIVLDGDMTGWIAQNTLVSAEMVLDGHSLTVNDFLESSYSFSKISGSGALSFNHKENGFHPSALSIGEVMSTYSGVITNNTTATLTIGTLALSDGANVSAGAKILSTGGTGAFSITGVTVGGVSRAFALDYRADGVYVYAATLTHGETVTPYASAQAAFNNIQDFADIITVYVDGQTITMSSMWNGNAAKIATVNDVTVTIQGPSSEYAVTPSAGEGYTSYALAPAATTYVWVGATNDSGGSNSKQWNRASNWRVGTAEGATATRTPGSNDTANLVDGAYVTGISVSDSLTITGSGTLTSTGAISLTTAGATLSVTGVTLSQTPTTTVSRSRVKAVTVDGTTTYSVEAIPGTIFSVY